MSYMKQEPTAAGLSREQRRARLVRGRLRLSTGREIDVVVRNMSEHGLGLSCRTAPPLTGEAVTIALPGHKDLDGVVRWVRNTSFGVELTGAVNPDDLAATLQRAIAQALEATDWTVSRRHKVVQTPAPAPRRIV